MQICGNCLPLSAVRLETTENHHDQHHLHMVVLISLRLARLPDFTPQKVLDLAGQGLLRLLSVSRGVRRHLSENRGTRKVPLSLLHSVDVYQSVLFSDCSSLVKEFEKF